MILRSIYFQGFSHTITKITLVGMKNFNILVGVVLQSYEVTFQPLSHHHHVCLLHLKGAQILVIESSPSLSECLDNCSVDRVVAWLSSLRLPPLITHASRKFFENSLLGQRKKNFTIRYPLRDLTTPLIGHARGFLHLAGKDLFTDL